MYNEIENILVRTLSPYEYEQIELLKQTYNEEQILDAYKTSKIKNINYITKVLQSKRKTPEWLNKEITNQEIDKDTEKQFEEFNKFIEEFRNE